MSKLRKEIIFFFLMLSIVKILSSSTAVAELYGGIFRFPKKILAIHVTKCSVSIPPKPLLLDTGLLSFFFLTFFSSATFLIRQIVPLQVKSA